MSPQLQWLGDIERDTGAGYTARALGKGVGAAATGYVAGRQRVREEEAAAVESKTKMAQLNQEQLMDTIRLINSTLSHIPEDKRVEMLEDPEVQAVYDAAGVPIPKPVVEDRPWAGTSWMDRIRAAGTPGPTPMEMERGALRPGGVLLPPVTKTRGATTPSRFVGKGKRWPEGTTEADIQLTMTKHGLTRRQVLERLGE